MTFGSISAETVTENCHFSLFQKDSYATVNDLKMSLDALTSNIETLKRT